MVVNSVALSRDLPVFTGFFEIIRVVLDKLNGAGLLRPVSEDVRDFYELVHVEQYTDEMGLDLGIDFGMAVVF